MVMSLHEAARYMQTHILSLMF